MTDKSWQKIIIRCPTAVEEAIASFVTELTSNGVEITEDKAATDSSIVIGYLATDDPTLPDKIATIRAYLPELARQIPGYPEATLELDAIDDEDWHRKWKESFKPFHLSETIVIKPSWENYTAAPHEKVIAIDPGLAFGTGLHASTRLAMELLDSQLGSMATPPQETLDVGTGTGILAIGASLLGCKNITAIDNDPDAISVARENIIDNNAAAHITASTTDLHALHEPYDLILANIIHNTLVEMAPTLSSLLASGGILIMAGILKGEQAANIIHIYSKHGLTSLEERNSGEWSALSFGKQ